jgi:LuxR family maltose regulon positive regulatory protein
LDPVAKVRSSAENGSGGAALEDRLLATKLYAPLTRTSLVTRPRLTERLEEGVRGNLTLLCAPAGFGKSTVLSEWVLQSELPVGWLSLDEGDNDAARFLSYMIAAIQTGEADIGEDALSLLRSPQPPPIQVVLTVVVNELATIPHDLVLILDDYHVITSEAVNVALAFLLKNMPAQLHLIIASRTDPPLPLSRLLAGGQLTKLRASDLGFTLEEATSFLNEVMSLELSEKDVAALERRTEGWIAGLQLAALSLQGREDTSNFISAFAGTNRHIFDYLAEEVLDSQPEDARAFLLQTSILDRLNGPLCDAVTGRGGGQARLEELEGMNLLIVPLDEERRWYRYHHLFSDFLRERLHRENLEMAPELHRRASVWHERNGTAGEAVGHALAARDFERAGDLIERLEDSMMGRGETPTLERLLVALPEEVVRSRPRLSMSYAAFVLMSNGRLDAAEEYLREAERMVDLEAQTAAASPSLARATSSEEDKQYARDVGSLVGVRATIAVDKGDLRSAITLYRRALELLSYGERASARSGVAADLCECLIDVGDLVAARGALGDAIEMSHAAGEPFTIARSVCLSGRLQVIQGRLSEAMKTYERVLRLTSEHGETGLLLGIGLARVRIGELLFECNDLEGATRSLSEGIELVLNWAGLGEATNRLLEGTQARDDRFGRLEEVETDAAQGVVPGYIALARVKQAQGDTEGGFEALRTVEQVAHNTRVSPLWSNRTKIWTEAWRARLWVVEDNLMAAERWAQGRELSAEDEIVYSPESELEYVTLARLLIAQDKHDEVSKLLDRLLEAAEAAGRGRTVIEVLVLQALALRARSDEQAALAALQRALTLAEPEGYIRVFADEGAPMAELLRRLLKSHRKKSSEIQGGFSLEYVGKLLEALGAGITAPTKVHVRGPAALVVDPVTERELEVLKLLDSELSNRQIAARMFVSVATVKTHIRHLYRKLGVTARHQAVARGRELGLL